MTRFQDLVFNGAKDALRTSICVWQRKNLKNQFWQINKKMVLDNIVFYPLNRLVTLNLDCNTYPQENLYLAKDAIHH